MPLPWRMSAAVAVVNRQKVITLEEMRVFFIRLGLFCVTLKTVGFVAQPKASTKELVLSLLRELVFI